MEKKIEINKWYYFSYLCIALIVINILTNHYLFSASFYHEQLIEQMSAERIKDIITQSYKYEWFGYLITPLFLFIKIILIAICLKIGLIFIDIKKSWSKVLNWIIKLETIFLVPSVIILLWFMFIRTDYTYSDLQFFYPLSLLNLFNPEELNQLFVYPLRLVNVFELLYWLALAKLFATETGKKFGKAFEFVMYTYGVGLLIWVVFVMFLTVNIS